MPPSIPTNFYRCTIERMLTNRQAVWYDKALLRTTRESSRQQIRSSTPNPGAHLLPESLQAGLRHSKGPPPSHSVMSLCVFMLLFCLIALVFAVPCLCVCVFQDVLWADDPQLTMPLPADVSMGFYSSSL